MLRVALASNSINPIAQVTESCKNPTSLFQMNSACIANAVIDSMSRWALCTAHLDTEISNHAICISHHWNPHVLPSIGFGYFLK